MTARQLWRGLAACLLLGAALVGSPPALGADFSDPGLEQAGASEVPVADVERREPVTSEWTAHSRTFDTDHPGLYISEYYPGRVNFMEDGEWQPIDSTLLETNAGFETTANSMDVIIADDASAESLTSLSFPDGTEIGYTIVDAEPTSPTVEGTEATFESISPGVDVALEALPAGVKETITVDSPEAVAGLAFDLDLAGVSAHLTDSGTIEYVRRDGSIAAVTPAGYMTDANGQVSTDIDYVLRGSQITFSISPAWLAEAVYPMEIDPTTIINTGVWDTYVNNASTADRSQLLYLNSGYTGTAQSRAFVRFPGQNSLSGMTIYSASLALYQTNAGSCTGGTTDIYLADETWLPSTTTSWYGPDLRYPDLWTGELKSDFRVGSLTAGTGATSSCPDGIVTADLTAAADEMSHGVPNYGFALVPRTESSAADFKQWSSGETYVPPSLTVVWSDPTLASHPTVPSNLSPDGLTNSASPTLSATYSDPQGDVGKVQFYAFDVDTGEPQGSWLSSQVSSGSVASVTLPTLALDDPVAWRAAAVDTVHNVRSELSPAAEILRPSVRIDSPALDDVVTGSSTISASLASGVSAPSVEFLVDGVVAGTDSSSPYSLASAFTSSAPGEHSIEVRTTGSGSRTSPATYVTVAEQVLQTLTAPDLSGIDLTGSEVDYLVDEEGRTVGQAEAELTASEQVEQISNQVEVRYPDLFAGSWMETSDPDHGIVAVANPSVRASLAAELPTSLAGVVEFVAVEHSFVELEDALGEVTAAVLTESGNAPLLDSIVSIDTASNSILAESEQASADVAYMEDGIAAASTSVPVALELTSLDLTAEPLVCSTPGHSSNCSPPLRGGIHIIIRGGGIRDGTCTAGFIGRRGRYYYVLTAGHCMNDPDVESYIGAPAYLNGYRQIGTVDAFQNAPGELYDYGVIRIRRAAMWKPNNIVRRFDYENWRIDSRVDLPQRTPIGRVLCHAGNLQFETNHGERCGRLRNTYSNVPNGGTTYMGRVGSRACHGDSGAPIFWTPRHRAVGILGAGYPAPASCSANQSLLHVYFTWTASIQKDTHVRVLTSVQRWGG